MQRWAGLALLIAPLLVACTKTDSSELKIDDMRGDMTVKAQEDGTTHVEVTITNRTRTLDYVELKGKDKLYVSAGSGTKQEMTKNELLNAVSYVYTFNGQASAGTSYKIEFARGDGFKGAANSSCALPATFAISAPVASTAFSRAANDVPVVVTAGNNNYALKWNGNCINVGERAVTDAADGSFTLLKTEIVASTDHTGDTCDVTLDLQTQSQGTVDSNWGAGTLVCSQRRTRIISSTP